jgi:hypothetical protein
MNDAELAQNLGEALRLYASQVSQGAVAAFRGLLTEDSVDVTVTLKGTNLYVKAIEKPKTEESQTETVEPTVSEATVEEAVAEDETPKKRTRK